jgi:hydrogenase maturation factor
MGMPSFHGPCGCVTCGDEAKPARVIALLPGGMAAAEGEAGIEEISVELCDAEAGDVVLVHAGVAIARLRGAA